MSCPIQCRDASLRRAALHVAGLETGIITSMDRTRKITVEVPEQLLKRAQKQSGEGVTETVRQGLELLAAAEAYDQLAKLRGTVEFSIDLETMRNDRT
jgi:hypothetical protein